MINGKITNCGKIREIFNYYYSPSLVIKQTSEEFENLYCFISRIEPWDNEAIPPVPNDTDYYLKSVHKNIVALKKININDMCPVIERIDWTANTIYSQYSSETNMFLLDSEHKLQKKFYVKNSYDQVFKCLSNGTSTVNPNGSLSTIEPFMNFAYDSISGYIESVDGYKWKYLYTIDSGLKLKFSDNNWLPVPVKDHRTDYSKSLVGAGEISTINVYNPGLEYTNDETNGNFTTTITITGDGYGANAYAFVTGNGVSRVVMSNTGYNYTYATATLYPKQGFSGNGAVIIPEISPVGGHGFNLLSELGCKTIMVTATIDSTENGNLPADIDYRQIGLLSNPSIKIGSSTVYANSSIYRLSADIMVSPGNGLFTQDEIVFQGDSVSTATFSGRVLNFDSTNNILYLINTLGTISPGVLIKGSGSNTIRVASTYTIQEIVPFSGTIDYIENRTKVQRSQLGSEQFRLTISY